MVTRTQLVADILRQQQQQRQQRPIRTPLQGLGGLGADILTSRAVGQAEEEKEEMRTAANRAQAEALAKILGVTGDERRSAITDILGGGQLDEAPGLRNALIQSALQQQKPQETFSPVLGPQGGITGQRSSLTGRVVADPRAVDLDNNIPASIREFDTLVETADLSPDETQTAARIRLKLTAGAGNLTVDEKLFLAQAKSGLKVQETQQLSQVKREEGFIDNAFAAAGEIQDINRASELIELVNTGGFEAAKASFTDFFGTTPGDVGELRRILAQNVLNGLAVFTGAISEGEREFLSSITTSIGQGKEVNKRNLARLKRIAENAVKRGGTILERRAKGGDENAINALADFNAVLDQGTPQTGTPTGRFNAAGEQLFRLPDGNFVARK